MFCYDLISTKVVTYFLYKLYEPWWFLDVVTKLWLFLISSFTANVYAHYVCYSSWKIASAIYVPPWNNANGQFLIIIKVCPLANAPECSLTWGKWIHYMNFDKFRFFLPLFDGIELFIIAHCTRWTNILSGCNCSFSELMFLDMKCCKFQYLSLVCCIKRMIIFKVIQVHTWLEHVKWNYLIVLHRLNTGTSPTFTKITKQIIIENLFVLCVV